MNRDLIVRFNNKTRDSTEQHNKKAKMVPKEPEIVAEVPFVNRLDGGTDEGKVLGTAKIEKLSDGNFIAHIDASDLPAETLHRGFSLGSFAIAGEDTTDEDQEWLESWQDR
jgi:hypothetical protein